MDGNGPPGLLRSGKASETALRVAALRAAHQRLDDPVLLHDPAALNILGGAIEAQLRDNAERFSEPLARGLRATVVVRSRFADDEAARAFASGVRQFVILGAGLDTFAWRHPFSDADLRVFEIDHPATQAWKRELLHKAGMAIPEGVVFAPVDFERGDLAAAFEAAGFRRDRPAFVSWLGVTMYLPEQAVLDTLSFVAGLPGGGSIVFDFRAPPDAHEPRQRAAIADMARRVASLGEPWRSFFTPEALREKLLGLNFSAVEIFDAEELNRRYLADRADGLRAAGRLCRARF